MKKLLFSLLVLLAFSVGAQDSYWSNYAVEVESQHEAAFYNLINDYFTANKIEGLSVTLYDNHIKDASNKATHILGFSGSLEALGNFYADDRGAAWNLLLTKANHLIKDGSGSRMGTTKAIAGDSDQDYPVQKYFIVHAEDGGDWDKAYMKYSAANTPAGMTNMMGNITSGISPKGDNRWVLNGFKDVKSAMGGANALRSEAQKTANAKAWKAFLDTNGESHLIRSGLRILMGRWE